MAGFEVAGKTVQDILTLGLNELEEITLSDLRKVVSRLVSAGNKRLRSFERAGENSPAVREVEKSGGAFSTRGKSEEALKAEFLRAKSFFENETSTRKGWRQVKKESIEGLKKRGIDVSDKDFETIWNAYEDLKEGSPEVENRELKYKILKRARDLVVERKGMTSKTLKRRLKKELTKMYETEAAEDEYEGTSQFFEF